MKCSSSSSAFMFEADKTGEFSSLQQFYRHVTGVESEKLRGRRQNTNREERQEEQEVEEEEEEQEQEEEEVEEDVRPVSVIKQKEPLVRYQRRWDWVLGAAHVSPPMMHHHVSGCRRLQVHELRTSHLHQPPPPPPPSGPATPPASGLRKPLRFCGTAQDPGGGGGA
ncbi:unnamed protein product [Pleuronectes platessa]|uniref:Uncharacterized protein n=1 Tax=Pleuronectes platessa TaxID=8262 RepID=A0A9N7YNK1_PLEPL|nr:unnamed protein product [Pleuronectes platessa]